MLSSSLYVGESMSANSRGYANLYNEVLSSIEDKTQFLSWYEDAEFLQGVVAFAPAWYQKKHRWYLKNATDDRLDGDNSTWHVRKYPTTGREPNPDHIVMRHFDLEEGENMITTHGKRRPVILINKYCYDWMHPRTASQHETTWLCIPVFSYKGRHTDEYIINDQRLLNPGQFFMPISYNGIAGFEEVCCAHLNAMQVIPEKYLTIFKHRGFDKGLILSPLASKLVIYHHVSNMNVLNSFLQDSPSDEPTQYDLFKEAVNLALDKEIAIGSNASS